MKLMLKILKLFAILSVAFFGLLFSASLFMQDKISEAILNSFNKNISAKLSVGSSRLSFLRKFPRATLVLKDVLVSSTPGFNSASFTENNKDTLLNARSVFVDFNIIDIIQGNYNIERIKVKTGNINLFTDADGRVNYNISFKKSGTPDNGLTINLEKINLTDISTCYNNLAIRLKINGVIKSGWIRSRLAGENIDFLAGAKIQVSAFQIRDTRITKPVSTELDISFKKSHQGIIFKKSKLKIENYDFGIDGSVNSDRILDLNVTGKNIDISRLNDYLPEKCSGLFSPYIPAGKMVVKSKINGLLSHTSQLHVEIDSYLSGGQINCNRSDLTISGISFTSHYSNGPKNCPETSILSVKDFKAQLGSAKYTGSFALSHFEEPVVDFSLKGNVIPADVKDFFCLKRISTAGGSFDFDVNVDNKPFHKGKVSIDDIIDLEPETNMLFNSFSIGLKNDSILFGSVNGRLSIAGHDMTEDLQFTYKGQPVTIDGKFSNFAGWLCGRPVTMTGSANITSGRLNAESLLHSTSTSEIPGLKNRALRMPEDMYLDINFKIDTFEYKSFSSSKVKGSFNYRPRLFTLSSLNIRSLGGIISGNGFIVQEGNKSMVLRGNFDVSNIDINKTFTTFHNFGQNFLKAENISGNLSGTFSLLLPTDSLLRPQVQKVTAEGKYILTNGRLTNFDPARRLSAFIKMSELENINFDRLENDFFIKDNFFYLPQMEVRSSATDLSLNGKHCFDNDYEYHVRVLLSEILSKKRKKEKNNISEFGVIEDDNLGRTSLLLKIEKKGKDIKVGYDMKAAGTIVKNSFKKEKQTLKTILNQEYGWYKGDSLLQQKPE
ncbi:MAG TPA: AsmA-like C-terminal region-containing protein, partial [Bacteroidales bacterium]|nr:AsmA-like C-terminal region-containing protein [Bacteroidales bacterium]